MPPPPAEQFWNTLAHDLGSLRFTDCSDRTREWARLVVVDALGCAAASETTDTDFSFLRIAHVSSNEADDDNGVNIARDDLDTASLWLTDERLPVEHAARYNACLIHHTEMDDGHPGASAHPGAVVVPAALAVAESLNRPEPEAFWTAIIAGYEAVVRLGAILKPGADRRALHTPGVIGAFGAACAAASFTPGPNRERHLRDALILSATLCPLNLFAAFSQGSLTKELFAGQAAYTGILAAHMAERDTNGPLSLLDAEDGLKAMFGPLARDLDATRQTCAIDGVELKPYASVRATHAALGALASLMPFDAEAVESIDVEAHPFAVNLNRLADVTTSIGAKCSLAYCIASLIVDGSLDPAHFSKARLREPHRMKLADRVRVTAVAGFAKDGQRGARVRVRFRDGSERQASSHANPWSASSPSRQAVESKLRRIAPTRADGLIRLLSLTAAPAPETLLASLRAPR